MRANLAEDLNAIPYTQLLYVNPLPILRHLHVRRDSLSAGIDFYLSRAIRASTIRRTGGFLGVPVYMSDAVFDYHVDAAKFYSREAARLSVKLLMHSTIHN